MKSFFKKAIGVQVHEPVSELDEPGSLYENQKHALVGWLAARMGQKLKAANTNEEVDHLLYLSLCLVNWEEEEGDVYLKIKEQQPSDLVHRCFLELYEEIKQEISSYLPMRHKSREFDQSDGDKEWDIYRDVIYASTQGKFKLIRQNDIGRYKEGKLLGSTTIMERSDIPRARDLAKQLFLEIGVPQTSVMSYLLVISEGVTNILKHAREGKMIVVESESMLHVIIEDKGPGFPLKSLPNMTLMAGYSTKKSMGQGFTLIMKMTERVLLSTIPGEGSTLILVFNRKEEQQSREKHFAR